MKDFFKQFPIFLVDLPRGAGLNTLNVKFPKLQLESLNVLKKLNLCHIKSIELVGN